MKYSGAGGQSSRQEVEACEKKLADASASQERVKTRHGASAIRMEPPTSPIPAPLLGHAHLHVIFLLSVAIAT